MIDRIIRTFGKGEAGSSILPCGTTILSLYPGIRAGGPHYTDPRP